MSLIEPKINSGAPSPSTNLMFFVILVENTRGQSKMLYGSMKETGNPIELWKPMCTNDGKDTEYKIQVDVLSGYFAKLIKQG